MFDSFAMLSGLVDMYSWLIFIAVEVNAIIKDDVAKRQHI